MVAVTVVSDAESGQTTTSSDILSSYAANHSISIHSVAHARPTNSTEAKQFILAFDLAGRLESILQLEIEKPIQRLASGKDGALWAVTKSGTTLGQAVDRILESKAANGETELFDIWRIYLKRWDDSDGGQSPEISGETGVASDAPSIACEQERQFLLEHVTLSEAEHSPEARLADNFRRNALTVVTAKGFCIEELSKGGTTRTQCFTCNGEASSREAIAGLPAAAGVRRRGELVTHAIDSALPRCRWHRVRVDAHVPPDTSFQIEIATNDEDGPIEGARSIEENTIRTPDTPRKRRLGDPHNEDWQIASENATDFLIDQPPGRYLHVRIRLTGTQRATPVIHRVRIDFPRTTSLDELPAIYREHPEAEDFTERFLSLFDAAFEDVDAAIERLPALLDSANVPAEVLPWLGSFLGIVFDAAWDTATRRRLLQAAPELYRRRGTLRGLRQAVGLILGTPPVIEEPALERSWGAIADARRHRPLDARLNSVRLFGKSRARVRLGRSALGSAVINSYGNPDHDALVENAHRITVLLPPSPNLSRLGSRHLEQLIADQKPAHTIHSVRVGGDGFVIGRASILGIDTRFTAPPPPILGSRVAGKGGAGSLRLNRTSILRRGLCTPGCGFRLDITSRTGIDTFLE